MEKIDTLKEMSNFVFASKSGDIAMRIQGKFPLKWKEQGKPFDFLFLLKI